jgi:hypothetical protein
VIGERRKEEKKGTGIEEKKSLSAGDRRETASVGFSERSASGQ